MGAGKGSGSFILPGLQKLRRICNTSDGQPSDGQVEEQGKGKGEMKGEGRRVELVTDKKKIERDREDQEHEMEDCYTQGLGLGRGVDGDSDGDGRCTNNDLEEEVKVEVKVEVELKVIVKDELDEDKEGKAIQLSKQHEVADQKEKDKGKEKEEEKEKEKEKEKENEDDVKGENDEGKAVEEGGLSMLSNGRIEFIAPSVRNKTLHQLSKDVSSSCQERVTTPSDTVLEPLKSTIMADLKSVPKGPKGASKGWVVPTKKKFLPATSTATATATATNATATTAAVLPPKQSTGIEKESNNDGIEGTEVVKITAQRVTIVKRLHGIDSKRLLTPAVPVPIEVTAESLLEGSGKLQVSSTSTTITPTSTSTSNSTSTSTSTSTTIYFMKIAAHG